MPEIFLKLKKVEPVYQMVYKIFLNICKLLLVADILITSCRLIPRLKNVTIPTKISLKSAHFKKKLYTK